MSNPALFLRESDVSSLVTVPELVDLLEVTLLDQAKGAAVSNPRQRLRMPGSTLHIMAGSIPGYFGYKAYTATAGKTRFLFFLFDAATTDLLAIIEADTLGQMRTGAITGVATRILSNPGSMEATLFGAGWQAESQLVAMAVVRPFRRIWIVNRNSEKRDAFILKMQPLVASELIPAERPEQAVSSSHVVTTMTNSREPVLKGEWLQPGQHINAAGGNSLLRRELDDAAILRADRVVVDSIEQAKLEAGEFLGVMESGKRHWQDFVELRKVVAGARGRVRSTDITLFKSLGLAIEDVAAAKLVYERAIERGLGVRVGI